MSVSSVKNLNGEVFSAVQDASLTNVVQTNSGNWNDISAYKLASANFITAHQDLSDYQTTAGMVNYYTTAEANTLSSMLSGAIDYVSGAVTGAGGGTTVVSGIDNGLVYISAEDAGAIYGKPYNGTYNGFFSAIRGATITNNTVSITCPEPTTITRIAANGYDSIKYKTSPNGEWIGPVYNFDAECEFVSNNGVVTIPISSDRATVYFSAYEQLDVTDKIVIPPFIDTDKFVKLSDSTVAFGSTNSASYNSLAVGIYNSAYDISLAAGYYNKAEYYSLAFGNTNSSYNYSLAFGYHSSANYHSLAGGQVASAYYFSLALGPGASAETDSLSLGERSYAKEGSLAAGYYNSATQRSMAVGYSNSAYNNSFAIGGGSRASNFSIAAGDYTRALNCSQSFGAYTSATNSGMAIGTFNNITTAAFVVGNGTYYAHSDAFVIFHDGSVSAAGKISANGVELGAGGGASFDPTYISGAVDYISGTLSDKHTLSAGEGISFYEDDVNNITRIDCAIGSVNNIVLTSTLPGTPDANTLYLIPEA